LLRQDDFNQSQLVLAGWRHGREYGGHLASCMIISCLANRQRLGWGNWLDIIDSIPKYSATIEQPGGFPLVYEPNFMRLLQEVPSMYDGSKDYAKGAVYWLDSAKPITNPWFTEKIIGDANAHPKIGDMNSLMLFR
jgi:hypothetical protein